MKFKPDPMGLPRNPFQVYLMAVAIFSGGSILIRDVPATAGTAEAYLEGWSLVLWAVLLVVGGTLTLAGMYWQWDVRDALLAKRLGLVMLSLPVGCYGLILAFTVGTRAGSVVAVLLGFAAAGSVQAWRVHQHIKQVMFLTRLSRL